MELQFHAPVDLPPVPSEEEVGGLQNRCGLWEYSSYSWQESDLDSLVIQPVA
jgi:hypothetical protein